MATAGPAAWNTPDAFVGRPQLNAYEPYPIVSSTAYSSNAPASWEFVPWIQLQSATVKNLVCAVSMNAVVPGATSQASTGSEGYTYGLSAFLFSRQDYDGNSTNLSYLNSGAFVLTASLGYSSTSQAFNMSWVTDSSGGTSAFTTTSNAGNWSSFGTGPKLISIPFVTTLTAGEYWMAFQHSSTAATSNSSVALHSFSKLQQQWPVVTIGTLGGSATIASSGPCGMGIGVASAITTTATMAASVISASVQPLIYFAMSNV